MLAPKDPGTSSHRFGSARSRSAEDPALETDTCVGQRMGGSPLCRYRRTPDAAAGATPLLPRRHDPRRRGPPRPGSWEARKAWAASRVVAALGAVGGHLWSECARHRSGAGFAANPASSGPPAVVRCICARAFGLWMRETWRGPKSAEEPLGPTCFAKVRFKEHRREMECRRPHSPRRALIVRPGPAWPTG